MSEVTVTLTKPLTHGDEQVNEIVLREPVAADYAKCGYPSTVHPEKGIITDVKAVVALIAQCGKLPPSVVGQLCTKDFNACMGVMLGFFG